MPTITIPIELVDQFTSVLNSFVSQCKVGQNEASKLGAAATTSTGGASGKLGIISSGMKDMFGTVGAGIAKLNMAGQALGFIKEGFSMALAESREAEQAALGLADAMRMVGDTRMPQEVLDWNAQAADAWNLSGEEISRAETSLIRVGHLSSAQAAELMKGAAGYRAQGKSIEEVASNISAGLAGSTRSLKDLGIQMEEGASKTDIYDAIVLKMKESEAATDAYASSAIGKAVGVAEAWKDALKEFGDAFRSGFSASEATAGSMQETMKRLGAAIGWVAAKAGNLIDGAVVSFHALMLSVETQVGIIVGVVLGTFNGITASWGAFKDLLSAGFTSLVSGFTVVWDAIKLGFASGVNWLVEKYSSVKEYFGGEPVTWRIDTTGISSDVNEALNKMASADSQAKAAGANIGRAFVASYSTEVDALKDVMDSRLDKIKQVAFGSDSVGTEPKSLDASQANADANVSAMIDGAVNAATVAKAAADSQAAIKKAAADYEKKAMDEITKQYNGILGKWKSEYDTIRSAKEATMTKGERKTIDQFEKRKTEAEARGDLPEAKKWQDRIDKRMGMDKVTDKYQEKKEGLDKETNKAKKAVKDATPKVPVEEKMDQVSEALSGVFSRIDGIVAHIKSIDTKLEDIS